MANFPSLPVEIVREILHLVIETDAESAWQYATVCHEWQYYFEEKTFSSLRVSSTDMEKLRHYLTPVRQSYVRELTFKVILPDLDDYNVDIPNRERETLEVQECNSRCFTDAVFQLFDTLASWQPPPACWLGQHQGICLHISASSPSDSMPPDYIRGVGHWQRRWVNSVLEIVQDEALSNFSDGYSTRAGQIRNPYNLTKGTSGSSGGSAVAVASNQAAIAFGTETHGSLVHPSSHLGLYTIKSTPGLLSRHGIVPGSFYHDTPGPMARSMKDVAYLLDIMAGANRHDNLTWNALGNIPTDGYAARVSQKDNLRGTKLGLPWNSYWSTNPVCEKLK